MRRSLFIWITVVISQSTFLQNNLRRTLLSCFFFSSFPGVCSLCCVSSQTGIRIRSINEEYCRFAVWTNINLSDGGAALWVSAGFAGFWCDSFCVFGSFLAELWAFTVQDCALLRCCHDTYVESLLCCQLIKCNKKRHFFSRNEFYLSALDAPPHKCTQLLLLLVSFTNALV